MSDLNRRNTESVFQSLHNMDIMIRETKLVTDSISQAVATLSARMTNIENVMARLLIEKMGNGPTVEVDE